MKCSKAHTNIHLFPELEENERADLIYHTSTCKQCAELAESMKLVNNLIARIAKVPIESSDPDLLTDKIMSSIKVKDEPLNLFELILGYFEFKQVKWAMAGISIFLAVTLLIEQGRPIPGRRYSSLQATQSSSTKAVLNAKNFQDELRKYSSTERTALINRCNDPFNITKYNVACLHEGVTQYRSL